MRDMKDSNIIGIGLIPANWVVSRIKNCFCEINERLTNEHNERLLSVSEYYGVEPRVDKMDEGDFVTRADSLEGYKSCKSGDLVMNIMLAWKRALGVSHYDGIVSPAYCVYRAKNNRIVSDYFHYLFRTDAYASIFRQYSTGIIDSRLRLYPDKFFSLACCVPPVEYQQRIVDYLDIKCFKIDSIIAKQETIIEKLKEYKLSIITEAVTKGLDPNVEMKESGIARIGSIPKEWDVIKITRLLDYSNPYPIGDGDHGLIKTDDYKTQGIPYIRVQNLGWGTDLDLDSVVCISDEDNKRIKNSELHPGDVLFCKTGATIGKTGIVPLELPISNTTSHVGKISVDPKYNPRFIFYFLSSRIGYELFWDIASMKSTRPELSIEEIKRMRVVVPHSRSEQDDIVDYLDNVLGSIDMKIHNAQQIMGRISEYKKSLIYEVVTGKKEV